MNLTRSIKRKKILEKKKASKKKLKAALRATAGLPSKCSFCNNAFGDDANPDEWNLKIEGETISLQCPECDILDT